MADMLGFALTAVADNGNKEYDGWMPLRGR